MAVSSPSDSPQRPQRGRCSIPHQEQRGARERGWLTPDHQSEVEQISRRAANSWAN